MKKCKTDARNLGKERASATQGRRSLVHWSGLAGPCLDTYALRQHEHARPRTDNACRAIRGSLGVSDERVEAAEYVKRRVSRDGVVALFDRKGAAGRTVRRCTRNLTLVCLVKSAGRTVVEDVDQHLIADRSWPEDRWGASLNSLDGATSRS